MAALPLLAHSESSTEPGRHPIPQWQQQGVIITIWVKVLPIFHARGHTARKGGRRGFKKKKKTHLDDKNVSIWKAAFEDIPTFHTVRGGYKTHGFSEVNSHHWLRMKVKMRSAVFRKYVETSRKVQMFLYIFSKSKYQSSCSLYFFFFLEMIKFCQTCSIGVEQQTTSCFQKTLDAWKRQNNNNESAVVPFCELMQLNEAEWSRVTSQDGAPRPQEEASVAWREDYIAF